MKKISRKISKGKSPSYVTTPFPRGGGRVGVRGFFLFFLLLFLSANYEGEAEEEGKAQASCGEGGGAAETGTGGSH